MRRVNNQLVTLGVTAPPQDVCESVIIAGEQGRRSPSKEKKKEKKPMILLGPVCE
jgi:hypothetical protein